MKRTVDGFFVFVRIWGAAWLAFLVSVVPLYIYRGTQVNDRHEEDIIMSVIGLVFGAIFLFVLQLHAKMSHRYEQKEAVLTGMIGVGLYVLFCIIMYLPAKNNYLVAVLGVHLSRLIGTGADEAPSFLATLLSSLIFGAAYMASFLTSTKAARKRHQRCLEEMKRGS